MRRDEDKRGGAASVRALPSVASVSVSIFELLGGCQVTGRPTRSEPLTRFRASSASTRPSASRDCELSVGVDEIAARRDSPGFRSQARRPPARALVDQTPEDLAEEDVRASCVSGASVSEGRSYAHGHGGRLALAEGCGSRFLDLVVGEISRCRRCSIRGLASQTRLPLLPAGVQVRMRKELAGMREVRVFGYGRLRAIWA